MRIIKQQLVGCGFYVIQKKKPFQSYPFSQQTFAFFHLLLLSVSCTSCTGVFRLMQIFACVSKLRSVVFKLLLHSLSLHISTFWPGEVMALLITTLLLLQLANISLPAFTLSITPASVGVINWVHRGVCVCVCVSGVLSCYECKHIQ